MSVEVFDLSEFSEFELFILYNQLVEKLIELERQRLKDQLRNLKVGMRVAFTAPDGVRKEGHVTRINRRTVSVTGDDLIKYHVPPVFLTPVVEKEELEETSNVVEFRRR